MTNEVVSEDRLVAGWLNGWQTRRTVIAEELTNRWTRQTGATAKPRAVRDHTVHFTTDLSHFYLRTMEDVHCLVSLAQDDTAREEIRRFKKQESSINRTLFILALTDLAYRHAKAELPDSTAVILTPQQSAQLLTKDGANTSLRRHLLDQLPKRSLITFDYQHPTKGQMFFGRGPELSRLRYERNTNFAIAGPGRIGKSSLVKQYRHEMLRRGDPALSRCFYLDFYGTGTKTPDELTQFITLAIDSSRRSSRTKTSDILKFFQFQAANHDGPLDLLLDEVDEVCQTPVFNYLAAATKQEYCRVVMCGRWNLFKAASSGTSQFGNRLELVQLEPLELESAHKLIVKPLNELDITVADVPQFIDTIARLTGRLPHLVQYLGKKLADYAIDHGISVLNQEHIEHIKWNIGTVQQFLSPIRSLEDEATKAAPEVRVAAYLILQHYRRPFSVSYIHELLLNHGLKIEFSRVADICEELYINNILAWSNGFYKIANEALPEFAKHQGFLGRAVEDAWRQIDRRYQRTSGPLVLSQGSVAIANRRT